MWKFTKKVRQSVAQNILKASWMGAALFAAAGYNLKSYLALIAIVIWWLVLQVIGHYILGLKDIDSG